MAGDIRPVGIEAYGAGIAPGDAFEQGGVREQDLRAGVLQHEGEPLRWIIRVERQIGAAGLEDADEPHDHLKRALHAQPHHHFGADAQPAQVMRQLVGAGIELAVGRASILEHHRDRIGCARSLRGEQLRHGRRRDRVRGVVPLAQDGRALLDTENIEPADRTLRLRCSSLQQPHEPRRQRLRALPREQVGPVVQPHLYLFAGHRCENEGIMRGIVSADMGEP